MSHRLLRLAGATVGCLALVAAGAAPAWAAGPRAGSGGRAAAKPAPAAGGVHSTQTRVRWTVPAGGAPVGSRVAAAVTVTTGQALHGAALELATAGPAAVTERTIPLGTLAAGASRTVQVPVTATAAGTGLVRATVRGQDPAGRAASGAAELHLATGAGRVALSANGALDAKLAALGFESATLGRQRYAQQRAALLGGGARTTVGRRPAVTPHADVPATTPVSGTIKYTDSAGGTHPARTITAELRDSDGSADGALLASVLTDGAGKFSFTGATFRADGTTPRQLFIRALAKGDSFTVQSSGATPAVQRVDSAAVAAAGVAITIDITANKTDDNNTALDVADALVTAVQYTKRINGNATLGAVTASYPDAGGTNFNPGTNTARILQGDRFDWDVILHEYGHFVDRKLSFATSPGRPHNFGQNLGETLGKDDGIHEAWDEGFASYFAISAEDALGTAALAIPKVGDTFWDDTEDAAQHVDMQTGSGVGEDDELSVAHVLWHTYKDAKLAVADTAIITALKTDKPTTLSAATPSLLKAGKAALFDDTGAPKPAEVAHSNDFACLYTDQAVSSKLTGPADGAKAKADTPQKFDWTANGAGPSNRLDKFTVQFWSPNFDKLVFESPQVAATTYTPAVADWKPKILGGKDANGKLPPTLKVVVKGTGNNAPVTGPYKSCAISIAVNHIDLVFAIDTTGSMAPYINSVVASASSIVDSLAGDGVDYKIGVVDYKDVDSDPAVAPGCPPDPYAARTDLAFSDVKADIQAAIGALPAAVGGGCDLPEDVYSGVEQAIGFPWRSGVKKAIIQLGDAPGHDPENHSGFTLAKVTADAAAVDPAVVFGILVGPDTAAHAFATALATATGGQTFDATANPAETGPAVLAAVTELALAPTANAGGPYTGLVGTPVDFDGSGSAASAPADIASYTWDFGDGSAPVTLGTPTVSHTYTAPLTGTVRLTVTDTAGKTGVSTADITVTRPRPALGVDTAVSADDGRTPTLTAPALTTAGPNELIAVTVSTDGRQGSVQQVRSVTGGGLTFARVAAATVQPGAAEVWTAFATAPLSGVRISATLAQSGFDGTITVVALTGARAAAGAVAQASGRGATATAALSTTAAGSLLLAVGHDWSNAVTPALGSGHEFVHVFVDTRVSDASWTERLTGLGPAAGTSVPFPATLRANDRWNLAAVEVVPAT
jgi:hypothetical protein